MVKLKFSHRFLRVVKLYKEVLLHLCKVHINFKSCHFENAKKVLYGFLLHFLLEKPLFMRVSGYCKVIAIGHFPRWHFLATPIGIICNCMLTNALFMRVSGAWGAKKGRLKTVLKVVEVTGLEPAASCSQSRHSSQTELHLDMIIKFLRSCSVVLWSLSCKIVALYTAVSIALFCCASSSSLYLPPVAVAFVTQSRHSSQTELHLEVY